MVLFAASRLAGLAREMIIGARFGTSGELDAYLAAFRIPDLLFQLVAGGALGSAFIPVFAGSLARGQRGAAWKLFSSVTNLVLVVLTGLAILSGILAPQLVRYLLAPGFSPEQQALTVSLMRWMLVSTVIFGVSGIVMGVLNSFQHFLLPALAPVLYNVAIIAAAWFLTPLLGVYGLVVGVLVGAGLHLDVQLFGLWRYGVRWSAGLGLHGKLVREVARLMAPRVLGLGIVQLNFWINTILASGLPEGSLSALNYAWLIMLLPQGVVAQAVATAAFPTFASLEARHRYVELRQLLTRTLRGVLFLAIPASAGLFVWREPLVRMLLERGEFTSRSTELTAFALAFFSLGLIGHSLVEIVARAFYALHDTRTPVLVGAGAMVLNMVLSVLLLPRLGHAAMALANTVATSLETVLLLWLLARRMQGLGWAELGTTALRAGVAAAIMAAALAWMASEGSSVPPLLLGSAGLLLGALLYLLAALALRMPELEVVRLLAGRARRSAG